MKRLSVEGVLNRQISAVPAHPLDYSRPLPLWFWAALVGRRRFTGSRRHQSALIDLLMSRNAPTQVGGYAVRRRLASASGNAAFTRQQGSSGYGGFCTGCLCRVNEAIAWLRREQSIGFDGKYFLHCLVGAFILSRTSLAVGRNHLNSGRNALFAAFPYVLDPGKF